MIDKTQMIAQASRVWFSIDHNGTPLTYESQRRKFYDPLIYKNIINYVEFYVSAVSLSASKGFVAGAAASFRFTRTAPAVSSLCGKYKKALVQ